MNADMNMKIKLFTITTQNEPPQKLQEVFPGSFTHFNYAYKEYITHLVDMTAIVDARNFAALIQGAFDCTAKEALILAKEVHSSFVRYNVGDRVHVWRKTRYLGIGTVTFNLRFIEVELQDGGLHVFDPFSPRYILKKAD